jgi:hypothetical protein
LHVVFVLIVALSGSHAVRAQDIDANGNVIGSSKHASSFGKSSIFGKVNTKPDRSQPMRLQGDQLIYDKTGNRVIARGNVEIFYNDNILTADEVVYDQADWQRHPERTPGQHRPCGSLHADGRFPRRLCAIAVDRLTGRFAHHRRPRRSPQRQRQ